MPKVIDLVFFFSLFKGMYTWTTWNPSAFVITQFHLNKLYTYKV